MTLKNKSVSARLFAAVSIGAIAISAAPAFAQSSDEDELDRNIIVVTGVTKQDANIQDVPITITAFSGEALEEQGIQMVGDVATFTPGFNMRVGSSNPTALVLSMRGQVQNDVIATLEPSVGVYLDEMYVARSYGMNSEMLDVSDLQVLKGPQGTLFGRNTSAGAVLIRTNDPQYDEISGMVKGTYGRFNERVGTAVLNLGFNDSIAVRGAILYGKRDGYKTDVNTGQKYEGRETLNGRVKVAFQPTDTLQILLSGEWYDGEIAGPTRQNLFYNLGLTGFDPAAADRAAMGGDPDLVAITDPSTIPGAPAQGLQNKMKTETYMAKVSLETDFGEIKWINGYRKIKGSNLVDLDGSSTVTGNHFTQGVQTLEQYSTELQLTGQGLNDALDYAVGITYFNESGFDSSRSSTNGDVIWSGFKGTIDNDSMGMYAQASYHINDALSFTGGLRYSIDDKGITAQSAAYPLNGTVPAVCLPQSYQFDLVLAGTLTAEDCNRSRSDTFKNLSYTAGLDYKISDDILVYAKHSKGYRSGAQQLRSLTLDDTAPAQPEIVHEQEIGLKTQFWDRRIRLNIAGFHNKVKGAQRSVILPINGISQSVLENANTEAWGMEADLAIEVVDGLTLTAAGSLIDPKYKSYNGFVEQGGVLTPNDKSDLEFTSIVEEQFSVGANYSADLGMARLGLNAIYAWQGKYQQSDQTFERLTAPVTAPGGGGFSAADAQAILDATTTRAIGITNVRASLAFGDNDNYEIALFGRNIFDERATDLALFVGGLNYVGVSYNEPATYGVTGTIKF
ncbi:TonB-dependent receptor [Parasphingorhabdus sp.]|uniref:TonB-dependent receptor n=1 Tax=Parasphingorhabdus sp. TaxID=2709688 RepID=UPI002F93EC71